MNLIIALVILDIPDTWAFDREQGCWLSPCKKYMVQFDGGEISWWWIKNTDNLSSLTLHREGGPALITSNMYAWFIDGQKHREDGPAVIFHNCDEQHWYLRDKKLSASSIEILARKAKLATASADDYRK